jgi:hypothetical protein
MTPEELFKRFINTIAARIESGGSYDEGIIDIILAQHALKRALEVLINAKSEEEESDIDIPDGWPPE